MMIGQLNKRVVLQKQVLSRDPMGGFTENFTDVATVWAALWPKSASEENTTGGVELITKHQIRVRYRSDIRADWRVKYGSRYFAVVSIVNPEERNEWLDLICKERM